MATKLTSSQHCGSRCVWRESWLLGALWFVLAGCGAGEQPDSAQPEPKWRVLRRDLPGALLSVSGVSENDIWMVGGNPPDDTGATVLHYDGQQFEFLDFGVKADLWWVFVSEPELVFMGGTQGTILRVEAGEPALMETPGSATVFGIWGSAADDLWAVGGDPTGVLPPFVWRSSGDTWQEVTELPDTGVSSYFKVWGRAEDDVIIVGSDGVIVHFDGNEFSQLDSPTSDKLLTVHGQPDRDFVVVGGLTQAVVLQGDSREFRPAMNLDQKALLGVNVRDGVAYAAGVNGTLLRRIQEFWRREEPDEFVSEDLHSVFVDPAFGVWAVGGAIAAPPLTQGIILHKGVEAPKGNIP